MKNTRALWFRGGLAAALMVITYLATTPTQYDVTVAVNDKLQHVAAFYVLALLADFSYPANGFGWAKFLWLLGYALAIELAQSYLPYRTAEVLDLVAGAAGLVLYRASVPWLRRLRPLGWRWSASSDQGQASR